MSMFRTAGIGAVICYKFFVSGLLAAIAIALSSTVYRSNHLDALVDSGLLEAHFWLIDQGLDRVFTWDRKAMQLYGVATGFYAVLILSQAIGLWCNQVWAKGLVIFTAGMSIPVEVYELGRGVTSLKLLLLGINLIIFGYFWHHLKVHHRWQRKPGGKL